MRARTAAPEKLVYNNTLTLAFKLCLTRFSIERVITNFFIYCLKFIRLFSTIFQGTNKAAVLYPKEILEKRIRYPEH